MGIESVKLTPHTVRLLWNYFQIVSRGKNSTRQLYASVYQPPCKRVKNVTLQEFVFWAHTVCTYFKNFAQLQAINNENNNGRHFRVDESSSRRQRLLKNPTSSLNLLISCNAFLKTKPNLTLWSSLSHHNINFRNQIQTRCISVIDIQMTSRPHVSVQKELVYDNLQQQTMVIPKFSQSDKIPIMTN